MVRQRLLGPVRFTLVIALLSALFITTAGVVSAAASITFTPGAGGTRISGNSWYIDATSSTATVNVDCGSATGACSVWAKKNNAPKASETLFTNVTGTRQGITFPFINDGCINLVLYDAGHAQVLGQLNVGHGLSTVAGVDTVCNIVGEGAPLLVVNNVNLARDFPFSNGVASTPPAAPISVQFDSGNAGGVDEAEVWISQSQPGASFTNCGAIAYPNPTEVLFTRNVSGGINNLALTGGGPYCFSLYQGSTHTTKIAGPVQITIDPYLEYVGGTPNGSAKPTQGTVTYSSGNGATNSLVCIDGDSTGQAIVPFTYNSRGFGSAVAIFQTAGAGQNIYELRTGVGALDGSGIATAASCHTGTFITEFQVTT